VYCHADIFSTGTKRIASQTGSQRPHQQAPDRDGSDIETAATCVTIKHFSKFGSMRVIKLYGVDRMMFGAGLFANEFGTLSFGIPKMYEFSPKVLETIDGSTLARLRAEDIHRRAVELRHVLVQQLDKGSSESESMPFPQFLPHDFLS
jgi:hypothetical protein